MTWDNRLIERRIAFSESEKNKLTGQTQMSTLTDTFADRKSNPAFILAAGFVTMTAIAIVALDLTVVAGLMVIPWFILLFYRCPLLLVYLWPLASLVDVFFPNAAALRAGGIKFLPQDPVYFFTIAILGLYALRHPKKIASTIKENKSLVIFLGMIALSIVVYTPIYGQSAIGEARKFYFVFLFPLLAAAAIKNTEDIRRFLMVVMAVASLVAAVAFYRAATGHGLVRVLNSEGTLILALSAFALLLLRINKVTLISSLTDTALFSVFSLLALASGQRSVWLSIGLGSLLLVSLYRSRAVFMFKAFMVTGAILVAMSVAIIVFPEAGSKLTEKFAGIIDPYSDKTASWRIRGWEAHLASVQAINPMIGEGLGGYYSWGSSRFEVTASPHNAYIQIMLKFGIVGLIIYGLFLFQFFRKALAARKRLPPAPLRAFVEIGIVCFGAAHGYMLGYGFEPMPLVFVGTTLGAMKLYQQAIRDYRQARLRDPRSDVRILPVSLQAVKGAVPRSF